MISRIHVAHQKLFTDERMDTLRRYVIGKIVSTNIIRNDTMVKLKNKTFPKSHNHYQPYTVFRWRIFFFSWSSHNTVWPMGGRKHELCFINRTVENPIIVCKITIRGPIIGVISMLYIQGNGLFSDSLHCSIGEHCIWKKKKKM